jgi:transcriptional regulator with XRE-family HTH domain
MSRSPLTPGRRERGLKLSRALSEGRHRAGLTQADLALRSGVSLDLIRSVEQQRVADPGFLTVADIAVAAALSLDELARKTKLKRRGVPSS